MEPAGSTNMLYTFSSLELHNVSTVESGLILYRADFSTPGISVSGVVVAFTACTGCADPLEASTFGLTSGPACTDESVTVMEVAGAVTVTLMGALNPGVSGPARLAIEPPSAAAYTVPSGIGTMARISGRLASYNTNALSLALIRYRMPFGSEPASTFPRVSQASAVTCDCPVS